MKLVRQVFMAPDNYRVGGTLVPFVAEKLRTIASNTQKMLASGVKVPVWPRHKVAGSSEGGPQLNNMDARDASGWLKTVEYQPDGSLAQVLEICDPAAEQGIESGQIQFSSPEIGDFTIADYVDGLGRDFGTVIRHVALTATPRNPKQGPFEALSHEPVPVIQFSIDDLFAADPKGVLMPIRSAAENLQFAEDEDPKDFESQDEAGSEETVADGVVEESGVEVPENPDMPKNDGVDQVCEAIVAHLEKMGISLPSDWKCDDEHAPFLLTALKTYDAAHAKIEAEEAEEHSEEMAEGGDPVTEQAPPMSMQFSEDANKEITRLKAQLAKSQEENAKAKRADLFRKFTGLPKPIVQFCEGRLNVVQFSEDGNDEPTVKLSEVADLFRKSLPKSLQFSEDEAEEADVDDELMGDEGEVAEDDEGVDAVLAAIGRK